MDLDGREIVHAEGVAVDQEVDCEGVRNDM